MSTIVNRRAQSLWSRRDRQREQKIRDSWRKRWIKESWIGSGRKREERENDVMKHQEVRTLSVCPPDNLNQLNRCHRVGLNHMIVLCSLLGNNAIGLHGEKCRHTGSWLSYSIIYLINSKLLQVELNHSYWKFWIYLDVNILKNRNYVQEMS